ncbi:hypothetical protein RKD24_000020 [Streptomyces calvus]
MTRAPSLPEVAVAGEVAAGAVDEPAEDTVAFFGDEDAGQVVDLAVVGDDPLEGEQAHAAPQGEASGADLGSGVAQQPEFVGGFEAEGVLSHGAGFDAVAAGEEFDRASSNLSPGLILGADVDAAAVEFGEVGGVAFERLGHEEAGWGGVGVVAEEFHGDVKKDAFTVSPFRRERAGFGRRRRR